MALIDIWSSSPLEVQEKHVQQVIAFAGNGKLRDGSDASIQFRELLAHIPSSLISRYADECLSTRFEGNGFALQDIINQEAIRL